MFAIALQEPFMTELNPRPPSDGATVTPLHPQIDHTAQRVKHATTEGIDRLAGVVSSALTQLDRRTEQLKTLHAGFPRRVAMPYGWSRECAALRDRQGFDYARLDSLLLNFLLSFNVAKHHTVWVSRRPPQYGSFMTTSITPSPKGLSEHSDNVLVSAIRRTVPTEFPLLRRRVS